MRYVDPRALQFLRPLDGGARQVWEVEERGFGRCVWKAVGPGAEEARRLARLRHPNLPRLLGVGEDATAAAPGPFMLTELLHGAPLADGLPPDADAADLLAQALRALGFLHQQGLFHGDLNPHNLFVAGARLVVLDLGLASAGEERGGTPRYLAPERGGGAALGAGADLFALGRIFAELGRADVPAALTDALAAPQPGDRPGSAAAASRRLAELTGRPALGLETPASAAAWWGARLVGRDGVLEEVSRALGQAPVVVLEAAPGVGATRLLEEICAREGGWRVDGRLGGPPEGSRLCVVDRGDFAGEGALVWMEGLLLGGGPGRVVIALGPGDAALTRLAKRGAGVVPLPALDREAVAALLEAAFPGRGDPASLAAHLHTRIGGRPGRLLPTLRRFTQSGLLRPGLLGEAPPPAEALPAPAADEAPLTAADIPTNGPEAHLLALAAVSPRPVPPEVTRAAFPFPAEALAPARERLTLAGQLADGPQLELEAEAHRAPLLRHLPAALQHAAHTQLAEAWAAWIPHHPDPDGRVAALQFIHRLGAGDADAVPAALAAAAGLLDRGLVAEAATLVAHLPEPAPPEAGLLRGRIHIRAGRLTEARRLAEALPGPDGSVLLGEVLWRSEGVDAALRHLQGRKHGEDDWRWDLGRGRLLSRVGRAREALECLRPLEGQPLPPAEARWVRHWIGAALLRLGQYEPCQALLLSVLAEAEAAGDRTLGAATLQLLAQVDDHQGRRAQAIDRLEASLALSEEVRDPLTCLTRRSHLATLQMEERGRIGAALDVFRANFALAKRWGHLHIAASDGLMAAELLMRCGDLTAAAALFAEVRRLAERLGHTTISISLKVCLARLALLEGHTSDGEREAEAALLAAEREGHALVALQCRLVHAEAALERGADNEARERYTAALETARSLSLQSEEAEAHVGLARACLAADLPRARAHAQRARAAYEAGGAAGDLDGRIEGHLALAHADDAEARSFYARRALSRLEAEAQRVPEALRPAFRARRDRAHLTALLTPLARPPEASQEVKQRLDRLMDISRRLRQETELSRLLTAIVDHAVELCQAERGLILLWEEGRERPEIAVGRAADQSPLAKSRLTVSRTVAEGVWRSRQGLRVVDALQDPNLRHRPSVEAQGLRSILCVPLLHRDQSLGALYLDHRFKVKAFSPDDLTLLQAFADQAAVALIQVRAEEARQVAERRARGLARALNAPPEPPPAPPPEPLCRTDRFTSIVGSSPPMMALFARMEAVARSELPVLIQGESGTGKELVARALATQGGRAGRPFVAVNCGALPEGLFESELFGHTQGAFTGADRARPGIFVEADGGTVFLDEVAELSLPLQVKLLRVLQEGEVRPVGSARGRRVDVRVLTATHRDLRALVARGAFREDLFYRIQVLTLVVPPLRQRLGDLALLCQHLLAALPPRPEGPWRLRPDALALLKTHRWPGNVRELATVLGRAAVFAPGVVLGAAELSEHLQPEPPRPGDGGGPGAEGREGGTMMEVEAEAIGRALKETGGNKAAAARRLGIGRRTLYDKLGRMGVG